MNTYTIQASPEARQCLESYFNEVVDLRKTGALADVGQYASRWCEQAARLAISLHVGQYGATAHQHPLAVETAENAVKLAKWFAAQQLGLLAKGRHVAKAKILDEVLDLLEANSASKTLDYITARDVQRAGIASTADAAKALLAGLEAEGVLCGEDITPPHGGRTARIFRRVKNCLPE